MQGGVFMLGYDARIESLLRLHRKVQKVEVLDV